MTADPDPIRRGPDPTDTRAAQIVAVAGSAYRLPIASPHQDGVVAYLGVLLRAADDLSDVELPVELEPGWDFEP
jgi:hypothetical protein